MKKKHSTAYYVIIFTIAQLIWLMLLGIWIYWYVSNHLIFEKVGDEIAPQLIYEEHNVFAFVGGLILLVSIWLAIGLAFRHLNVQLRTNRVYDTFIANVTHELKSPLSSIQLYLETLINRDVPKEKREEFYNTMLKDSQRLQNLIDSILEMAALGRKHLAHDFQVYSADEIMRRLILESVEQQKLSPKVLHMEGKLDCLCVLDVNAFKIVFDNLINNAVKYSTEEPTIAVKLTCTSKKIQITIKDNGVGIPWKEQRKVFNKFYRIHNNNIPNVKGTGLGLFWVREIINNHGGKISVHSDGYKKGSSFFIEIPVFQKYKKRFIDNLLKMTDKRKRKENLSYE